MDRPVLGYWECRGLVGGIRALLSHLDIDYEDKQYPLGPAPDYDRNSFRDEKESLDLHFANLPYFIDEDVRMTESKAIIRYIAAKHRPEYLGRTLREQAKVNTLMEVFFAANLEATRPMYTGDLSREQIIDAIKAFVPQLLSFKGSNKFACGQEPSFVDFFAFEYLEKIQAYEPSLFSEEPRLGEYLAAIQELPGMDRYAEKAHAQDFNMLQAKWNAKVAN